MTPSIDFDGINAASLRDARSLLPSLIPGGKIRSLEYIARNPRRDDQRPGSFSINYRTGVWKDFASNDGGADLISLVAYLRGSSQGDAARELADKLGVPLFKATHKLNGHNGAHCPAPAVAAPTPIPIALEATEPAPKVYAWGDAGPPVRNDEIRRHVYSIGGCAVRVKIKRDGGGYVNWYRIGDGWQPKQPEQYQAIPYRSAAMDPLDSELIGDEILWPEGEKDVDGLSGINFPAFTFGGVGDGLRDGVGQYLKDRRLVILADNDEAGRAHAHKKAAIAHAAGAASIKIVHFPELPPKGDVSDFIAGGGTAEQLMARFDATPIWSPPVESSKDRVASPATSPGQGWRTKIVMANDLQGMTFPPVRQILPGYISEGATIIAGKPKIGKSWLTLDLCLAATANRFTLGTLKPAQGDVLYLALEDNNRRLKRRMAKIWASIDAQWPERLALVTDWKRADEGGLDDIEDWCRSVADPVMVVIDTLEKFRPVQNGKTAAYSADYAAMTGLQKIAGRYRIAVVANHHVRKMEADDPFDTVSGTLGLTGAADTIVVLKRHAGAVTLHARGRDIEEVETALQFERATCRWTILGAAADVYVSNERTAVLSALATAGADGLAVSEIMAATGRNSRGAMDTLLFKMKEDSEIVRVKRGIYALPQDGGKIGQKERIGAQSTENIELNGNLPDLSDLTAALIHSGRDAQ
jgi:AAA domain-containing protein